MAVKSMATMAIRSAVTTWPRPRLLSAPKADIGATGCNTIIPYRIRSQSVSARRNLGAVLTTTLASLLMRSLFNRLNCANSVRTPGLKQAQSSTLSSLHHSVRYWSSAMLRFAQLCESIAALYLCGRVFPRREERVLSIGFSLLLRAVATIAKNSSTEVAPILRRHGDLGAGAEEILRDQTVRPSLTLPQIAEVYASLAQRRGPAAKQALLEHSLQRLSALEAKYFIKIATGELRIGLKKSLVEDAIAKACDQTPPAVQRANMLTGDITDVVRLAAAGHLSSVKIELLRPISVMLASPADTAADLVAAFPNGALVEDKFDGIRAQVHKRALKVEIYSRTLDRVTEFPELLDPIRSIAGDFILDGEIIGWRDGRAIPFTQLQLQQRLGR